jgi:hypothetical protein
LSFELELLELLEDRLLINVETDDPTLLIDITSLLVKDKKMFNLNSTVGSDEEPQDLDGERHEDFEGHILGSYVQKV